MKRLVRALIVLCAAGSLVAMVGCGDDGPSDEDAIEKFIEDITGPVNAAYVERALGYLDTKSFPIDVMVPGHQGVYDEAATPKLVDGFRKAMTGRFNGAKVNIRSKKYEITGDSAEVTLNLLSKAFGMARWEFTLRKRPDAVWKVSRVYVIR